MSQTSKQPFILEGCYHMVNINFQYVYGRRINEDIVKVK